MHLVREPLLPLARLLVLPTLPSCRAPNPLSPSPVSHHVVAPLSSELGRERAAKLCRNCVPWNELECAPRVIPSRCSRDVAGLLELQLLPTGCSQFCRTASRQAALWVPLCCKLHLGQKDRGLLRAADREGGALPAKRAVHGEPEAEHRTGEERTSPRARRLRPEQARCLPS
eukprot:6106040-Prymnesium_polylepis.1